MPTFQSTSINFDTLAVQLTPTALRKPVWQALVKALLAPVKSTNTDYDQFRADKRLRMDYNGQVRLLENVINRLMIGSYDIDDPVIYLDEPETIEEFLISPGGWWAEQNSIHYDPDGKDGWDAQNHDPLEAPERYGILYNRTSRAECLGFEVHLTPTLHPDAPVSIAKTRFYERGGEPALRAIVDAYKLAGKRYVVIQDDE